MTHIIVRQSEDNCPSYNGWMSVGVQLARVLQILTAADLAVRRGLCRGRRSGQPLPGSTALLLLVMLVLVLALALVLGVQGTGTIIII